MDKQAEKQSLVKASQALRSMLREHWTESGKVSASSPLRAMADRIREKEKANILRVSPAPADK